MRRGRMTRARQARHDAGERQSFQSPAAVAGVPGALGPGRIVSSRMYPGWPTAPDRRKFAPSPPRPRRQRSHALRAASLLRAVRAGGRTPTAPNAAIAAGGRGRPSHAWLGPTPSGCGCFRSSRSARLKSHALPTDPNAREDARPATPESSGCSRRRRLLDMAGKPLRELAATVADRVPVCVGEDGQVHDRRGSRLPLQANWNRRRGPASEWRQSGVRSSARALRCQAARRIAVLMGNVNRDH